MTFERSANVLKAGQWCAVMTLGAGGFGPPDEREPEAVARDLALGVIAPAVLHDVYRRSMRQGDQP